MHLRFAPQPKIVLHRCKLYQFDIEIFVTKRPSRKDWNRMKASRSASRPEVTRHRSRRSIWNRLYWRTRYRITNAAIGLAVIAAIAVVSGEFSRPDSSPVGFTSRGSFTVTGIVDHVRDGDTLEVAGIPIRFETLDCAELGTEEGEKAKLRMRELALGELLSCQLAGRSSYDRQIGNCRLTDGRDVGEVMISDGWCARWGAN